MARQAVTFMAPGEVQEAGVTHRAVTRVDIMQAGALVLTYDGEDGPEQVIYAAGAWAVATSRLEVDPRG